MPENKFKFDDLKYLVDEFKREVPIKLAAQAQNYFVRSFSNQGWEGRKWQEVQRRIPGTKPYMYPKKKDLGRRKRPILIGKGSTKLRRAVVNSVRVRQWPTVRLVVDLPYAQVHNEGGQHTPQRKYMGHTSELGRMQKTLIKRTIAGMFEKHKKKL